MADAATSAPPRRVAFAALHHPAFRMYFGTSMLAMMADNIEHVISYWVLYQTFHSPALMGFAVISHWGPSLLFSVYTGMLADRYDCRRLIQLAQVLFLGVSLSWGVLFLTDTLAMWHAIVLLAVHGIAVALWGPASQMILHDMVGREHLPSAVRLNATGRNLGLLLGPGVGGLLLLFAGPPLGMLINTALYLPLILWLNTVPYTGHSRSGAETRRPGLGLGEVTEVLRAVSGRRTVAAMVALAAATSFFVGNAFQAQMPEFAHDLGTDEAGLAYSALLAANAAGAVLGGVLLESLGLLRSRARTAVLLASVWCVVIGAFAATTNYFVALLLLFLAGLLQLAYSAMAQTVVQLEAPAALRGRVLGVFNMAQLGLRVGSGFFVGVLGNVVGVHWSLALSAAVLLLVMLRLLWFLGPPRPARLAETAA